MIFSELVKANSLHATPEQIKAYIEEFSKAYEEPQQVLKYYYSDRNRLAEIEAMVVEENVVKFVLEKAKVKEVPVAFDELMSNQSEN